MVTTNTSSSSIANTIGDPYGFNSTSNPYTTNITTSAATWEPDTTRAALVEVYDEVIKIKKMFFAFLNMFAIVMADKSCDNGGECGNCMYCYFNKAYEEYVKEILEKM